MLVSVLVDTYNHARFLPQALDSVLAQELPDAAMEVVVVDDGSTDDTPAVLARYGERVRVLRKENGGQGSAFNAGIRACRGEWIAFLDGDDWWLPGKLARVVAEVRREPALVAVGHGLVEVDELAGRRYDVAPVERREFDLRSAAGARAFTGCMAYLGTSRLFARRDVLLSLLDVPEALTYEADEYLFTLLPACGRVAVLPDRLTCYRIHGGNLYQGSRTAAWSPEEDERARHRARMRANIHLCLAERLPGALARRGCAEVVVDAALAPLRVMAARLKLRAFGGSRIENLRSEWRAARLERPRGSVPGMVLLAATLVLALLLPPRTFFHARDAYSRSSLRRFLGRA